MVTSEATVPPIRFVQLLADEQRWRLLQELARSDRKVSELTELVGRPQNLVSYHLASLRSAGSHPKPLHPNAVRVMAERGIDISTRTSKHLDRFTQTRFDRVITLCDKVREICPQFPGAATVAAHWSMPDPASEGETDET